MSRAYHNRGGAIARRPGQERDPWVGLVDRVRPWLRGAAAAAFALGSIALFSMDSGPGAAAVQTAGQVALVAEATRTLYARRALPAEFDEASLAPALPPGMLGADGAVRHALGGRVEVIPTPATGGFLLLFGALKPQQCAHLASIPFGEGAVSVRVIPGRGEPRLEERPFEPAPARLACAQSSLSSVAWAYRG